MALTLHGFYTQGKIELSEIPEDVSEGPVLVTFVEGEPNQRERDPKSLYGLWRDAFPLDFDVDSVLDETRQEWQHEIEEIESHA